MLCSVDQPSRYFLRPTLSLILSFQCFQITLEQATLLHVSTHVPLGLHLLLLRTRPFHLIHRNALMLALPIMLVQPKPFGLRLRYPRKHTHLQHNLTWVGLGLRLHRTITNTSAKPLPFLSVSRYTHFPSFPQKNLNTLFPLPVSLSSNTFNVPSWSSILTADSSSSMLLAT